MSPRRGGSRLEPRRDGSLAPLYPPVGVLRKERNVSVVPVLLLAKAPRG